MKVLHVASGDLWGGAEAQLLTLCRASRLLGVDVSVAVLNSSAELSARLSKSGIPVFEYDEGTTSALSLVWKLVRLIHESRPDVVHTHRFKENVLGGAAAAIARTPSVRTLHGAPEPELRTGALKRRLLDALDTFFGRRVQDAVVAVSEDLARRVRPVYGEVRVSVIVNGVDESDLRSQAARADPVLRSGNSKGRYIGYFGRLVSVKRIDLLLAGFLEYRRSHDSEARLLIYGDGPLKDALEKQAAATFPAGSVSFEGFCKNSAAHISDMSCIVLTSDHEGLPLVVLEALALGTPVAARSVGGIPEVIAEVESGAVAILDGKPASISNAIAEAVRAKKQSATSMLPERFTAQTMASSYRDLYSAISAHTRRA